MSLRALSMPSAIQGVPWDLPSSSSKLHHVFVDIADWEPEPEQLWRDQALGWLLPGHARRPGPFDGQFIEAVADFTFGRCLDWDDDWSAMEMLGALIMQRWCRDHPALVSKRYRRNLRGLLAPLDLILCALLALILLALRAVSPEPSPGRPDDAILRVPAAPLVRAHAILTAAPPSSPAQVPAGAPA